MALNWEALAEQIDGENAHAAAAVSSLWSLNTPGTPRGPTLASKWFGRQPAGVASSAG
jgi:hypothetical protein